MLYSLSCPRAISAVKPLVGSLFLDRDHAMGREPLRVREFWGLSSAFQAILQQPECAQRVLEVLSREICFTFFLVESLLLTPLLGQVRSIRSPS